MKKIYFQPLGINPKYCEVGMIFKTDPEHIWYIDEPCKIPIKEVKIINENDVIFDNKEGIYIISKK